MNKHPKGAALAYARLLSISALFLMFSFTSAYAQCPVTIGTQPTGSTVCAGSNANVDVIATNAATYQWEENTGSSWAPITDGGIYSGATTANLVLTGVTAGMSSYSYRCVMVDACAVPLTSDPASITVDAGPKVAGQPSDAEACEGEDAGFGLKASGGGLVYQWQVDDGSGSGFVDIAVANTAYTGADTRNLTALAVTASMDGYAYQCVITGTCGSPTTSDAVKLTVNTLPAITTHPIAATTICEADNTSFTAAGTGTKVGYQWQVSDDGGANWNDLGDDDVYQNTTSGTLNINDAPADLDGHQYRCVIFGACSPSLETTVAVLTVNALPKFDTQPKDIGVCDGDDATIDLVATGAGVVYQWEINKGSGWALLVDDATYTGSTTTSLAIKAADNSMHGYKYRCVISGTCTPSATSDVATLHINLTPTVSFNPYDKTVCATYTTTMKIAATGQVYPALKYQWQVDDGSGSGFVDVTDAGFYSGTTTNEITITGHASLNKAFYRCVVSTGCGTDAISNTAQLTVHDLPVITNFTQSTTVPVCPGTVVNYSIKADGTGITYVWQVDDNSGAGYVDIPALSAMYNGSGTPNLKIIAPVASMNNYQYRCVVRGACSPEATTSGVILEVYDPVNVVAQSGNTTTCESANTSLSVTASGSVLKYQWQKQTPSGFLDVTNAPPYSGATTATLTFTNAPMSLDGTIYRCLITETAHCNVTTVTTNMTVSVMPRPEALPAKITALPLGSATFSVATSTGTYQWQENHNGTGYTDLVEAPPYFGVTTNTLTINPLDVAMSGNTYRCIVTGPCAPAITTSKEASLIVDPLGINHAHANSMNYISIYPNPVTSEQNLNVSFENAISGKTDIRIIDKMGQLVRSSTVTLANANATSVDVSGIAAGVYTIQVVNGSAQINASMLFNKQ